MDETQAKQLKDYGVVYYILENEIIVEWLLNYRGGSFLAPHLTAIEEELLLRGVSYAILGEASLSFLGLGVTSDTPTWGLILADGRSFISRAWWMGVFPGMAIMLTVLSINFLGDALRDALDVRETTEG